MTAASRLWFWDRFLDDDVMPPPLPDTALCSHIGQGAGTDKSNVIFARLRRSPSVYRIAWKWITSPHARHRIFHGKQHVASAVPPSYFHVPDQLPAGARADSPLPAYPTKPKIRKIRGRRTCQEMGWMNNYCTKTIDEHKKRFWRGPQPALLLSGSRTIKWQIKILEVTNWKQ